MRSHSRQQRPGIFSSLRCWMHCLPIESINTVAQHMLCAYQCVADAECPAPGTGTARPACMHGPEFDPATLSGQCMLRCDAGETCPDGFVCADPGLAFVASDGSSTAAPAQCVQFHRLTLSGEAPVR